LSGFTNESIFLSAIGFAATGADRRQRGRHELAGGINPTIIDACLDNDNTGSYSTGMNNAIKIMLVNNTGKPVLHSAVIIDCIRNASPLPEELADIFTLKIIDVAGERRGILEFA
jgi:hypothetical protein